MSDEKERKGDKTPWGTTWESFDKAVEEVSYFAKRDTWRAARKSLDPFLQSLAAVIRHHRPGLDHYTVSISDEGDDTYKITISDGDLSDTIDVY